MATAVVNDLFPKIKGTITSLVMIASSLCNYTILTAAAKDIYKRNHDEYRNYSNRNLISTFRKRKIWCIIKECRRSI